MLNKIVKSVFGLALGLAVTAVSGMDVCAAEWSHSHDFSESGWVTATEAHLCSMPDDTSWFALLDHGIPVDVCSEYRDRYYFCVARVDREQAGFTLRANISADVYW